MKITYALFITVWWVTTGFGMDEYPKSLNMEVKVSDKDPSVIPTIHEGKITFTTYKDKDTTYHETYSIGSFSSGSERTQLEELWRTMPPLSNKQRAEIKNKSHVFYLHAYSKGSVALFSSMKIIQLLFNTNGSYSEVRQLGFPQEIVQSSQSIEWHIPSLREALVYVTLPFVTLLMLVFLKK